MSDLRKMQKNIERMMCDISKANASGEDRNLSPIEIASIYMPYPDYDRVLSDDVLAEAN